MDDYISEVESMERAVCGAQVPEKLEEMAEMAVKLGLDEIDPVFIMDAFDKLRAKDRESQASLDSSQKDLEKNLSHLEDLEKTTNELKTFSCLIEDERENRLTWMQTMDTNTNVLRVKQEEYTKRTRDFDEILNSITNGKPFPTMNGITGLLEDRKKLLAEQHRVSKELEVFSKLPEDWTLAQIEVARAEKHLESLLHERDLFLHKR